MVKTKQQKISTKEKILEAALRLFNEHGCGAVSTNHIAKECGISPGNLYFHYSNKAEIIRALYERMVADWDTTQSKIPLNDDVLAFTRLLLNLAAELYWKYRFIHRELATLCMDDKILDAKNKEVIATRKKEDAMVLHMLVSKKYLRELSGKEIEFLVDMTWLISIFWQPYIQMQQTTMDEAAIKKGAQMIEALLEPYRLK